MGVAGPSNFDNDEASEYLDSLIQQLVETIEDTFSHPFNLSDGEAIIMPSADVLVTICRTYDKSPLVDGTVVKRWKETYLQRYDERIQQLGAGPEYISKRRQVIEETFSNLENVAQDYSY